MFFAGFSPVIPGFGAYRVSSSESSLRTARFRTSPMSFFFSKGLTHLDHPKSDVVV